MLGEVAVADASHELEAVAPLLDRLLLSGETVTLDPHFTQYVVADQIVRQGGAYLVVVKGNQRTVLADGARATAWLARPLGAAHTVRLAHGRIEERTLKAADAWDIAWPHVRQVLRLHRRFVHKRTGRVLSDETVYAVTSLTPAQASPAELLALWQAHWTIENRLHWLRAVVFGENQATTHTAHAPQPLAAFCNLAVSLLQLRDGREVTTAGGYYASHPAVHLRHLGVAPLRTLSQPRVGPQGCFKVR